MKIRTLLLRLNWIKYWKEGYDDSIRGNSFAMNPYPTLASTSYAFDNDRRKRGLWSRGYWAAQRKSKK